MSLAIGLLPEIHGVLDQLPLLVAVGWVVRVPLLSPTEGHEAITRVAWVGLALTDGQRAALIRGVRAPDVSIRGLASFVLASRQPRHALRAHASSTTEDGIRAMRAFLAAQHNDALTTPGERRRWELVGKNLHCIQDSFSPAHADREGARIVRMKHWGPLDRFRGRDTPDTRDEHGFPTDRRDLAFVSGALSEPARQAAAVTRDYLELLRRQLVAADTGAAPGREELEAFLDQRVTGPIP